MITVGRLALSIVFFVLLSTLDTSETADPSRAWWAVLIFVVAAVSDVIDGYLARKWQVVTGLGRVLDPAVDKILIIGGLVYLAAGNFAPASGIAPWMVILVIGREFLVTSLRAVIEGAGGKFPADWTGKTKMFVQSVAVPVALGQAAIPNLRASPGYRDLATAIIWLMLAITTISILPALKRGWGTLAPTGSER